MPDKPFSMPVSSKSAMQAPITVVSQPSIKEVPNGEERKEGSNEGKNDGTQEEKGQEVNNPAYDDFMNSSIVAIPRQLPTMLDVRCKDPNFRPRWVNFVSDNGRFLEEKKAMGFRLAKPEEIIGLPTDSLMVKPEGIKYHDVILMVVPTKLLFGWYKHNAIESANKVNPKRLHQAAMAEGEKILRQGIANEGRNYKEMAELIGVYIPGQQEIDKKGI
jgi:hypothetical protein